MSETPESTDSIQPVPEAPVIPVKTMIEELVRDLVGQPDAVKVTEEEREEEGERFTLYLLHVDQSDLGKVIGKNGRTARALRAMVNALAARLKVQAELEIFEPDRPAGDDEGRDERGDDGDEGGEGQGEDNGSGDDENDAGDEGADEGEGD